MSHAIDPVRRIYDAGSKGICPISWDGETLFLLDQRLLPHKEKWLPVATPEETHEAIRQMVVRGAPAIGIVGAFGVLFSARALIRGQGNDDIIYSLECSASELSSARPTAVNLKWAIERMVARARDLVEKGFDSQGLLRSLEHEALSIWDEDVVANITMGRLGAELVPEGATILTHCNAGALATGGFGTALGVVRAAFFAGKARKVLADETRPWLQGIRLTAWELMKDGIPVEVICDSAAGHFMAKGEVDMVVVGADRIASNGDVANKIGTYQVAVLAKENQIPFYVAAPTSTLDPSTPNGRTISIEERSHDEVVTIEGVNLGPSGVRARNPVFDITPNYLITAIITEKGVLRPPFDHAIGRCLT